jgi:hypothetical protein
MHEWPLRWAAPQHSEVDVKVRNGPIMSIDTKGGKKTFAADANQVGFQYQILKTATESSYSNCCTTTSNHRPRLPFRRFDANTCHALPKIPDLPLPKFAVLLASNHLDSAKHEAEAYTLINRKWLLATLVFCVSASIFRRRYV